MNLLFIRGFRSGMVIMKAEGLAILGAEKDGPRTAVKLLITYDNDPHATHIPSRIQRATLVRETR
jgi:hypothetical protein